MVLGLDCLIRPIARRLLRSTSIATASKSMFFSVRKVSKECSFVGAKSVVTGGAVKTTLSMAIDPDVAGSYLSKIRTRFLIAPLSLNFHRASPQLVDALIITLKQASPA